MNKDDLWWFTRDLKDHVAVSAIKCLSFDPNNAEQQWYMGKLIGICVGLSFLQKELTPEQIEILDDEIGTIHYSLRHHTTDSAHEIKERIKNIISQIQNSQNE